MKNRVIKLVITFIILITMIAMTACGNTGSSIAGK